VRGIDGVNGLRKTGPVDQHAQLWPRLTDYHRLVIPGRWLQWINPSRSARATASDRECTWSFS
jgi:hypothetical protein